MLPLIIRVIIHVTSPPTTKNMHVGNITCMFSLIKHSFKVYIHNRVYDDVENYIYGLNVVDFCKAILEIPNMVSAVLTFIKSDEKRAIETLKMIENEYLDVSRQWEDYDNFGEVAYNVIRDNLTYVSQEISAKILYDVSYNKNRFNMKRLVDKLLDSGVDHTIEDMLK